MNEHLLPDDNGTPDDTRAAERVPARCVVLFRYTVGILPCLAFLLLLLMMLIWPGGGGVAGLFLFLGFLLVVLVGLPSLVIARRFASRPRSATWLAAAYDAIVVPGMMGLWLSGVFFPSGHVHEAHYVVKHVIATVVLGLPFLAEGIYLLGQLPESCIARVSFVVVAVVFFAIDLFRRVTVFGT